MKSKCGRHLSYSIPLQISLFTVDWLEGKHMILADKPIMFPFYSSTVNACQGRALMDKSEGKRLVHQESSSKGLLDRRYQRLRFPPIQFLSLWPGEMEEEIVCNRWRDLAGEHNLGQCSFSIGQRYVHTSRVSGKAPSLFGN